MIKVDKTYHIRNIHRYVIGVREVCNGKVSKRYEIQWHRIVLDFKNFIQSGWAIRYTTALFGLVLFIKTGNPLLLIFHGALTLDSATESNNTASFNVTVAANSNRIMIMGFGHYQGGGNISAADYNSDALTVVKDQPGSFGERAALWGLVAPDTGTNTFTITGNDSWTGYGVISVYDADQNLPTNTAGFSDDQTVELTTTVDNAWVVAAIGAEPAITMTTTSGVEDMNEQGESFQNAEMHHVLKATAGVQTVSYGLAYGARSNIALCELKPAAAAAATPKNLTTLGVG